MPNLALEWVSHSEPRLACSVVRAAGNTGHLKKAAPHRQPAETGLWLVLYRRFLCGANQLAVFEHYT